MEIRIVISDRWIAAARWWLGRRKIAAWAGACVLIAAGGLHALSVTPTNVFKSGDVISSSAVNQNFAELFSAVAPLQNKLGKLSVVSPTEVRLAPGAWVVVGSKAVTNTAQLILSKSNVGLNGFDTPPVPNTLYNVFAVENAGALGVVASLQPEKPTGFAAATQIGRLITGESGAVVGAYALNAKGPLAVLSKSTTGVTPPTYIFNEDIETVTLTPGIWSCDFAFSHAQADATTGVIRNSVKWKLGGDAVAVTHTTDWDVTGEDSANAGEMRGATGPFLVKVAKTGQVTVSMGVYWNKTAPSSSWWLNAVKLADLEDSAL
jgi:hypothetical protein